MRALYLHIEHERGGDVHALNGADVLGELVLLLILDRIEAHGKVVGDVLAQIPDAVEVAQEALADLAADELGELGVAQAEPAARRDAVRHVHDAVGVLFVPCAEEVAAQDLAVDLRDAVHLARHIDGEICHAGAAVADDVQSRAGQLALQPLLDLLEDVADLGHDAAQEIHVPALERFAHDGVVRVGKDAARDVKGAVKVEALRHEQADELGDGHGGVRIVELHGGELAEAVQIAVAGRLVGAQNVLQRGAREEVLLLDAQALALARGVVRVEHARDVLGAVFLREGALVVLPVEGIKVELPLGFALPQAQRGHIVGLVADDRRVVRHGEHGLVGKAHLHGVLLAAIAPRVAELLPVVGGLLLRAVFKALLEKAEAVAQTVAAQRHAAGGGAVHIARGETAEAAVAERRVFDLLEAREVDTALGKGAAHFVENAEIEEVAVHEPPDEIFGGEIKRLALSGAAGAGLGPVVCHGDHHRAAERVVQMLGRGLGETLVLIVLEQRFGRVQQILRGIHHTLFSTLSSGFQAFWKRFQATENIIPDSSL